MKNEENSRDSREARRSKLQGESEKHETGRAGAMREYNCALAKLSALCATNVRSFRRRA